ncbi:MAG: YbhB/YbcL family Raf kinase inhibitor-like protein [Corticimicrobacter sp.]|uniref:YbhB/YbcL family Raf kinase inhibitor-like protein n=1 Tax=Corticimicrobacter sp. TaxID=2678536 RepID=UPI0032DAC03F
MTLPLVSLRRLAVPLMLVSALAACKTVEQREAAEARYQVLDISFSWSDTAACGDTASPLFSIRNVPSGTQRLRFIMVNAMTPSENSSAEIDYTGRYGRVAITRGAFEYTGPCIDEGTKRYQWTVEALDAEGNFLGGGKLVRPFPDR